MATVDPYIAKLKREAARPVVYYSGITPARYFQMVSRLEVEIEVGRLNRNEPKDDDALFMKLVRYIEFIRILSAIKNSSPDALQTYKEKMAIAQTFIGQAEEVKEKIVERLFEERIRLAEEAARNPPPPPPPVIIQESLPTPSFPSAPPPEPSVPEPTLENLWDEPQMVTRKEDRIYLIPPDVEKRFLQAAWSNTKKGIETCGILVGELRNNEITIDGILLPPQTGSFNTCEALDELKVSEWQIKHSRVSVGWIHTHPTQEAFLSSIDLHTHFSYQSLQPEALAIVCAPTDRKLPCGMFRITDYGMEYLKTCNRAAGFHPHDDAIAPLFEEAPVRHMENMKVQLVDFR